MRKLQREPQKHDGSHHPVRDVRRPSWEDADKMEAEIMTPRDRLQRLLFEHRTAHDPASSEREILAMFEELGQLAFVVSTDATQPEFRREHARGLVAGYGMK